MLKLHENKQNSDVVEFCRQFLNGPPAKRFILCRNDYAKFLAKAVDVHAFADDFTADTSFLGKPVTKTKDIPSDGLVVATSAVQPLTAREKLSDLGLKHLNCFAFFEHAGLTLPSDRLWGFFKQDFEKKQGKILPGPRSPSGPSVERNL